MTDNSPLHDNEQCNILHERFTQSVEQLRKRMSGATTSPRDRTACLADIALIEGRLQQLSAFLRDW